MIDTRAHTITFFEDRAEVLRVASLPLTPGPHTLTLTGATVFLDDPSLQLDVVCPDDAPEGARVLTSRVRRVQELVERPDEDAIQRLEQLLEQTARDERARELEVDRLRHERTRLEALETMYYAELERAPLPHASDPEVWRDALGKLNEERERHFQTERALRARARELQLARERARAHLALARRSKHELRARIEVQLDVSHPGTYEVRARYFTPCALWRPAHLARLIRDPDEGARVRVSTLATAWQNTGEVWEDVRCVFSTARPTQAADAPALQDDILYTRPKTERERRVVEVAARDVSISTTGADATRSIDEMPGVDDGGEPLRFEAPSPVSIPSTGTPFQVQVQDVWLPATVEVVAFPERRPVAYLRAQCRWNHTDPLLAGPVQLMREQELAGRSKVNFVAVGATLELGFGVESSLRVQREVSRTKETHTLRRKHQLDYTVTLYVSNLSREPRAITLVERVPVSEIDDVTVKIHDTSGAPCDENGFVHVHVDLPARGTTQHTISYEILHATNVHLSL